MGPIVYRCWPGFEHNNWLARALVDHGCLPDIAFPARSGNNPRFWIWRFFHGGKSYSISTDYGRLGRRDLAEMLTRAGIQLRQEEAVSP